MRYHVNGSLVPADEAAVSVRDRGFMYGDAAFETLRAYGGEPFEWRAHAERLARTCELLGMPDAVPGDLYDRILATLTGNGLEEAYVRVSVTRGVQSGKLTPSEATDPGVVVVVKELPRGGPEGENVWDGPVTVETASVRRIPDAALPARAKTHNYLNGVLARLDAPDADEAFLTNTTWEVRPVERADDVSVGGGPVTELLAHRFDERVAEHYDGD